MEENIEVVESVPQEEATEEQVTETVEETIPDGEETGQPEEAVTTEAAETEPEITIPIRYNHETRTLSKDEAATYAQKGLQAESVMAKLRYLAAAQSQSVQQVVDSLFQTSEDMKRSQYLEKVGGDEELANQLMEAEKQKHQKLVEDMLEAEKKADIDEKESINTRLANEFIELNKEFPDISDISKLPNSVLQTAAQKNISLMDAYLRSKYVSEKKAQAVKASQETAKKSAVGAQASGASTGTMPEIDALLKGIFN